MDFLSQCSRARYSEGLESSGSAWGARLSGTFFKKVGPDSLKERAACDDVTGSTTP